MVIHFPEKPEVKLSKAPLAEVICQLRFPILLRLAKDMPADFQETVRAYFPVLKVDQGILVQFPSAVGSDNPTLTETLPKVYHFTDASEERDLTLAPDFLALSFHRYTHWHEFLENAKTGIDALVQHYSLPYSTRIGLRFVNQLTLENTGSKTLDELTGLLRSELTVMLKTSGWDQSADMLARVLLQDEGGKLALRYGLRNDEAEIHFLLDFDYFEEGQISLDNLPARLNHYHDRIYAAFRWCVSDEILNRFVPIK